VTEIVLLLASPVHRYEGRQADGAAPFEGLELPDEIEVHAGLGIVGDRFYGKRAHARESVTIMAAESIDALGPGLDASKTRRNIITRGLDIDAMRGLTFSLDSGDGPVLFTAHRPANPCAWMDVELAPGAHKGLRKHGGMRCEPLTDGRLRLGPVTLSLR
jgi:MOSC domain-containing protein YiiM